MRPLVPSLNIVLQGLACFFTQPSSSAGSPAWDIAPSFASSRRSADDASPTSSGIPSTLLQPVGLDCPRARPTGGRPTGHRTPATRRIALNRRCHLAAQAGQTRLWHRLVSRPDRFDQKTCGDCPGQQVGRAGAGGAHSRHRQNALSAHSCQTSPGRQGEDGRSRVGAADAPGRRVK